MSPPIPRKLDLKKDSHLRIEWADGESHFPLIYLRQMCPCAACRALRTGYDPHQLLQPDHDHHHHHDDDHSEPATPPAKRSLSLSVLPENFASEDAPPQVASAQLVGNYALQIEWTDGHTTGIYSFAYLREIAPTSPPPSRGSAA